MQMQNIVVAIVRTNRAPYFSHTKLVRMSNIVAANYGDMTLPLAGWRICLLHVHTSQIKYVNTRTVFVQQNDCLVKFSLFTIAYRSNSN